MKLPLLLMILLSVAACSKKVEMKTFQAAKTETASRLMPDGRYWTTANLDIEIPDSYCTGDDTVNCTRLGRLYTWQAAREGCASLGEGWRLPTDGEWQTLAKSYGGIVDDSDDKGHAAYVSLMHGGDAGFNAQLAGNREEDGTYRRVDAHGFYWTSTESDSTEAWFYNFAKDAALLNHHTGNKKRANSVRCVRD